MRRFWLLLVLLCIFVSCREPRTAVSCANMGNSSNGGAKGNAPDGDPHFFKRRKKSKAEHGYRRKERKQNSSGEKAEKGEKKQRGKSKAEKKFALFKKRRRDNSDAQNQNKGVFKNNEKKRKKEIRKRVKHPQDGLFPKGKVGK